MMKWIKYISLVVALVSTLGVTAQNKYCLYDDLALEAYQNKDFARALELMDSAMALCEEVNNDSYAWHVKGFICRDLYKSTELGVADAKSRECAIESFMTSLKLDTSDEFKVNNVKGVKSMAIKYQNDAVNRLDTNHYEKAIEMYDLFKSTMIKVKPDYDFTAQDIMFNNALGGVYEEMYENDRKNNVGYLDKAVASYQKTLAIDSTNYTALFDIGIIYYNKGVDLILELDDETDLKDVIDAQEKLLENCILALPYLKKAYKLRKSKEIIEGFRGIYKTMNDMEKYLFFDNELKKIEKAEQGGGGQNDEEKND